MSFIPEYILLLDNVRDKRVCKQDLSVIWRYLLPEMLQDGILFLFSSPPAMSHCPFCHGVPLDLCSIELRNIAWKGQEIVHDYKQVSEIL